MAGSLLLAAFLAVSPVAEAGELTVQHDALINLDTAETFTRADCMYDRADCRGTIVQVRHAKDRQPGTYLEFPNTVDMATTDLPFGRITPTAARSMSYWQSALGFLRRTLVVQVGDGATYEFALVTEGEGEATIRFNQVAPSTADAR